MTLHVELECFAEETKRHTGDQVAYISRTDHKTHVTAANPATGVVVSATTKLSMAEARKALTDQGMKVSQGAWEAAGSRPTEALTSLPYIAAVAYKSGEDIPGIWVDAYEDPPSPATALKAIYDEFRETGEVGDISFEEFVRLANPNIAILNPSDIERFLDKPDDA